MPKEYHKIENIFERDNNTKKIIEGKFQNNTVEFLKNTKWQFTEKIDGTNIRVYWDGHKVSFYGRTENAQIPAELFNRLNELFGGNANEELFEQRFGEKEVMLIGEGFGPKIQKCGAEYRDNQDFILFDVLINDNYLSRDNVENIAEYFGIQAVPVVAEGELEFGVDIVKAKPNSMFGTAKSEGLVARPKIELKDKDGKRIIVKIKVIDY